MAFIQALPVEMALLAAGDMLAYAEVAAAVGLIAANTRLRPLVGALSAPVRSLLKRLPPRPASARQSGARPALRRKAPPADTDGAGLAFA